MFFQQMNKLLLFASVIAISPGCKTFKSSDSEILEDAAGDTGTTPSEHVQQDGATDQAPDQAAAKPVPTSQPSDGQTQQGNKDAKDRVEKGETFVAKVKDWWNEMLDFIRSVGKEKARKDQSVEELKAAAKRAAAEFKDGNPAGMYDLRDIVAEMVYRVDPTARVVRISSNERGDVVVTETKISGTSGELGIETSVSGGASTGVDIPGIKTNEEIAAEAKTGSKYTLDSKLTISKTYRQPRVGIRIISKESDGSTVNDDVWYLKSETKASLSYPWDRSGDLLEPMSFELLAKDIDRDPSCRCSHCRNDSQLPAGYFCKERNSCDSGMCSRWEPIPPKAIYVDLWYYPESKRMVRRTPAFEAADRELEYTLFPRVRARIQWLTATLQSLETEYRPTQVINSKTRDILKSVETFVKKSPIDFDQARALDATIRTHAIAACSAKSLLPIVNDVKAYKASVDDIKPDFERVLTVLAAAGEDRNSLEVNWTNWTLPFADLDSRIAVIEKEEKANYCAKMQAAIDALGAKLDQERINAISQELQDAIASLTVSLQASKGTMIFAAVHDRLMFEGLQYAENINRARLKRQYSRANTLIEQAKQWIKRTDADLAQSPLSPDQRNVVRKGATATIEMRIAEWNQMVSESGQEGILNRRIFKLGKKLPKVLSAIKKMPEAVQSELIASWRDKVSEQGFVVPAQCFLKEHEQQPYCWQLERQSNDASLQVYDRRLDALDYLMDSYMLEIAVAGD